MADAWTAMHALLDGALHLDVVGMVAESDRVAAELRSRAMTKAGRYDNGSVMLFTRRGGMVSDVQE